MFTNLSLRFWSTEGDGRPRSPVYGIWDVVELRMNGQALAPAEADYDRRWRRVIFDAPDVVAIQRTDDSVAHYGAALEEGARRMRLSKGQSRTWRADFDIQRVAANELRLSGEMDGHRIEARLRRVELDTFRLRRSPFDGSGRRTPLPARPATLNAQFRIQNSETALPVRRRWSSSRPRHDCPARLWSW